MSEKPTRVDLPEHGIAVLASMDGCRPFVSFTGPIKLGRIGSEERKRRYTDVADAIALVERAMPPDRTQPVHCTCGFTARRKVLAWPCPACGRHGLKRDGA